METERSPAGTRYDGVLFDLLSALLDSWSLWNAVAGSPERGLRWRREYLRLTYGTGAYRPYESLVAEAARGADLSARLADDLVARWDELAPWPEAPGVLAELGRSGLPLGVVTNCSESLGARAAARLAIDFRVLVTAERAGRYKPDPRPYRVGLAELGTVPERTLFVAGSAWDVPGATGVGMPVVWHNRLALPPAPGGAQPRAIYRTLTPLLDEVLGPAGDRRGA